ncbi:MAG: hypothetical protein ACERKJ_07915, partial [Candidatus Dadabacteria bacterium]
MIKSQNSVNSLIRYFALSLLLLLFFTFTVESVLAHESIFRANKERSGEYKSQGLKKLKGIKWKYKTLDKVRSSPVVSGNNL